MRFVLTFQRRGRRRWCWIMRMLAAGGCSAGGHAAATRDRDILFFHVLVSHHGRGRRGLSTAAKASVEGWWLVDAGDSFAIGQKSVVTECREEIYVYQPWCPPQGGACALDDWSRAPTGPPRHLQSTETSTPFFTSILLKCTNNKERSQTERRSHFPSTTL
jgi:hypothetical protein